MARAPLSIPLILVLLAATAVGCSRPPELVGIDNPEIPAESVAAASEHRLFIMSTRQASEVAGAFYGGGRAPELGLASVDVTVPPNHIPGHLERPEQLPPDPRSEFAVVEPIVYRADGIFIQAIDRELAKRPPGQRRLLLFIHGYNNTTSDAILRVTQFVHDTGFPGVPVLFTWASAARAPRYVYDLNSALVARSKLKQVADILSRTRASSLDVFAHSMGSLLAMEGFVDAQDAGRLDARGRIATVMLASPDIDIDLFRSQIGQLPASFREKMYLLISKDDDALRIARVIAGGVPRVGAADAAELEQFGVTVIDLSEIDDSSAGSHAKFAGSPEVVQLIGVGLNNAGRFDETSTPVLGQLLAEVPIRILGQ
jgi:esterase/lipase superfamily enzyme